MDGNACIRARTLQVKAVHAHGYSEQQLSGLSASRSSVAPTLHSSRHANLTSAELEQPATLTMSTARAEQRLLGKHLRDEKLRLRERLTVEADRMQQALDRARLDEGEAARASEPIACDGPMVHDHAWVGVMRMAPGRQQGSIGISEGAPSSCDGLCHGFGDTAGYAQLASVHDELKPDFCPATGKGALRRCSPWAQVAYGCWFFVAPNASAQSHAYVNVGRSLRLDTRCDVHEALYGTRQAANQLCTHNPGDKYWCVLARARGFDSIQIRKTSAMSTKTTRKPWGELVLCSGACATQTFRHSACVPMARSIGAGGTLEACDCPAGAQVLTCNGRNATSSGEYSHPGELLPTSIPGERAQPQNRDRCKAKAFTIPQQLVKKIRNLLPSLGS